MTPTEFETKMKAIAYKYHYEELIEQEEAEIQMMDLMVIALAEDKYQKGIWYFKNFVEE